MCEKQYFVMLSTHNGGLVAMADDDGSVELFETESDARESAKVQILGFHFGFEVFRIGDGI